MKKITPRKYETLKDEFGVEVADHFLSLCNQVQPMFVGPVTYQVTTEAHQYALTVATGKTFEEREAARIANIDWNVINALMVK